MHTENDGQNTPREVIHRMSAVMRKHHAAFDALREETGLGRSAHYTLMRLSDADNVLSQTEIAGILEISTAAVTNMLKRLEADGYVTRQPNPADTRVNNISLTDKGSAFADIYVRGVYEAEERAWEALGEEERRALAEAPSKFNKELKAQFEKLRRGK